MNLLRAAGRALLASYFIANGAKAVKNPDALVPATAPLAERLVPLAQRTLPEAASAYVPEDTRTIVRLSGLAAIAGGLGMATGIAPRAGGALAVGSMVPHLLAADPRGADDRRAALGDLATKLALAGAALMVTQDTRGRPSMLWRASDSAARLNRNATRAIDNVQADVTRVTKRSQKQAAAAARRAERFVAHLTDDAS